MVSKKSHGSKSKKGDRKKKATKEAKEVEISPKKSSANTTIVIPSTETYGAAVVESKPLELDKKVADEKHNKSRS